MKDVRRDKEEEVKGVRGDERRRRRLCGKVRGVERGWEV